jgi:hypothetical protein
MILHRYKVQLCLELFADRIPALGLFARNRVQIIRSIIRQIVLVPGLFFDILFSAKAVSGLAEHVLHANHTVREPHALLGELKFVKRTLMRI